MYQYCLTYWVHFCVREVTSAGSELSDTFKQCFRSGSAVDPYSAAEGSGSGIRVQNADPGSGPSSSILIFFSSCKKWFWFKKHPNDLIPVLHFNKVFLKITSVFRIRIRIGSIFRGRRNLDPGSLFQMQIPDLDPAVQFWYVSVSAWSGFNLQTHRYADPVVRYGQTFLNNSSGGLCFNDF